MAKPVKSTTPSAPPAPVPPLYRSIDWWTFGVTVVLMFVGYLLTLSPNVTLEDSGELATGSKWAGIPHPPGYPVWTVITWVFTKILPFSNIAFRVQVASAVAASLACGLLGMLVSRGSSMIIESIDEFKGIDRRFENALCFTSGFVGALLIGFNGFMWSQAVIVEVYPLSVLMLLTMLSCILRWMYAPHQMRFLYWAAFLFGVCITGHQTLLVAAMGIEVAIIAGDQKLGRDLLVVNCVGWFLGLMLKSAGMISTFDSAPGGGLKDLNMVFVIFNLVGMCSLAGLCWLIVRTHGLLSEWKHLLVMVVLWTIGVGLFFYMPLASMSNPPMNWGYPRTVEGFFHALSRGQYEKTNPTNFIADPKRFMLQTYMYFQGAHDEFTWVYLLLGLVPFYFFFRMHRRERAWLTGLFGIFMCLAFLLMILMNPSPDRQTQSLIKVFFTSSYVPVVIWVGYGLTLIGAWLAMHYQRSRFWVLCGAGALVVVSLFELTEKISSQFFGQEPAHEDLPGGGGTFKMLGFGLSHLVQRGTGALPIWGSLLVVALVIAFIVVVLIPAARLRLACVLAIFFFMPISSIVSHWADNEQHNHMFGFYFGHDMFTPPYDIYPEMDRDTVLFGGTDPGRFCPTYMIFCESFIPPQDRHDPKFDRRDVYIITQNALADNTYLEYIRAHYNRSAQIDPPFFQNFLPTVLPKVFQGPTPGLGLLDDIFEGIGARIEKSRRTGTSWFEPDHFTNVQGLAAKLRAGAQQDPVSKFVAGKLSPNTQSLLAGNDDKALRKALAHDFNEILEGGLIYDAERFKNVKLPVLIQKATKESPLPNEVIRLNRRMLEEAYPGEIAKSLGGVFPDTEIHTPSPEDSQECFNTYVMDAQRRMEAHQLKAGEDVHVDNGRVSVSGQTAVMGINGLLTKVIFDRNPDHEFYLEESFPLDWMYPYLTPFGIIMKINRHQVPEITQEMVDKDHKFWSRFASERLIGNWLTYDTTIKEVCEFAEKVYLHRDYSGFDGDLKFIRDDDAQKAFSKLRSSIASSVYMWRSGNSKSPEEHQRMLKEAEFALKQAVSFCPYSPEAVFHLVQLLLSQNRLEDALLVAKTCHNLDPYNGQVQGLVDQLQGQQSGGSQMTVSMVFQKIQQSIQNKDTNSARELLQTLMSQPTMDSPILMQVAEAYVQMRDFAGAEQAVLRATQLAPAIANNWYNLAALRAYEGHIPECVQALKQALDANKAELATDPKARNLSDVVRTDRNFDAVRNTADFQKLMQSEGIK
jgi:tetratricopeptide (TPR) repeat protein